MRRFVLCFALLLGIGLGGQQAQAADDLDFATPVVRDVSPACDVGACSNTRFAHSRPAHYRVRRPIARWFQNHRPVLRVARGVAKLVSHRCCR